MVPAGTTWDLREVSGQITEEGCMRRRVLFTVVITVLALMMAMAGGPAALAASKRLPTKVGPDSLDRSRLVTPKIVGGKPVTNGKYPFQAALLAQSFGTNDFERQFCGGSLISPFDVLTAAHCVEFFGDGPEQVPLSDLRVVVGRTVLTSTQGQKRRAGAVSIHPRYDPVTASHDVAVVHLASPIFGIRPVMLVTPGVDALERPGTMATVTGWGNTIAQPVGPGGGGVNYPNRMREAKVPIVSRVECKTALATVGDTIDATMLCAGATNLDTCQGDSGGPLFFKAVGPGYIQVGVTSWGYGCGATGFPGVYARLSNRAVGNFILEVTGGAPVSASRAA
jgi:secreted trypsin-like serine protease